MCRRCYDGAFARRQSGATEAERCLPRVWRVAGGGVLRIDAINGVGAFATPGRVRRLALAAAAVLLLATNTARGQTPPVRFAAPASCPLNVNCIPGFKRVYGID